MRKAKSSAPRSRQAAQLPSGAACPRFTFEVRPDRLAGEIYVEVKADSKIVGEMAANMPMAVGGRRLMAISYARVSPDYQRCGLGTQLYERMMREACKRRAALASDAMRSAFSQGFWSKQLAKGRAECMRTADPEKAKRGNWMREDPMAPLADKEAVYGRGGCERYAIKSCRTKSLAGLGGTRKRR